VEGKRFVSGSNINSGLESGGHGRHGVLADLCIGGSERGKDRFLKVRELKKLATNPGRRAGKLLEKPSTRPRT